MRLRAPAVLLLGILVAACSNSGPGAGGPDPKKELRDSASAMAQLHSVIADLTFGPGVTLEGFTLVSAQSKIKPPSDSDSTFKVKQNDFLVDVRVVTVGGAYYLKVPFSQFTQLPADQAAQLPDPARLMDPSKGLPALMANGRKPAFQGSETVDGHDCSKVTALYSASAVAAVLGSGVKPSGDVTAVYWIGKDDHLVRRVTLKGDLVSAGQPSSVEVHMHDFDAPLDIAKPV